METKMKSVLVTGAAGHIGSNLCQWLLDNQPEYQILALDDLSGGFLEWIPKECKIYIRNCGDKLDDIFSENDVRIVFHAAAEAAESVANFNRKFYYTSNVVNSANIINYCIQYPVDRLVYFSSMAVYGRNPVPFTEDQIPFPCDCYGIGKYAIELDLLSAKNQHGLKYTIVRPHSVYGPNQNLWDAYRNVLAIWCRQVLNNEPISIYGDGSQTRAFTYIDDIMEPLWKCAVEDSTLWETFNIGNDDEISIMGAAKVFIEILGERWNGEVKYFPQPHEVQHAWSDHAKVKYRLGLECKTSLKEGLEKMWSWAQTQPKRKLQTFDEFELEVGLYEQFWKK